MKIVLLLHITITMAASINSLQRHEEAINENSKIRLLQGVKEGRQILKEEELNRTVRVSQFSKIPKI